MSESGATWVKQKVGRICFRGDDRPPTEAFVTPFKDDVIFTGAGFEPKEAGAPVYGGSPGRVGDIRSGGVCVTTRFNVAPLFPLGSNRPKTYIYAVWIDEAWNTHAKQVYDAQDLLAEASGGNALVRFLTCGMFGNKNPVPQDQAKDLMWALFGEEIVAERIPAGNVIGAIPCERKLEVKDGLGRVVSRDIPKNVFRGGIDYALEPPIIMNSKSTVPLAVYQSVLGFFSDELKDQRNGRTPAVEAGFVRSDPKAI